MSTSSATSYIDAMTQTQQADTGTDQQLAVELGVAIQSLMFRKRVTQTQLARAMGLTQSAISQKLHARTAVTVADLYAIARVLDVDPGDLLPRLDSNQQPSGYASAQVSAAVAQYGRAAALYLDGRPHRAAQWLDFPTDVWFADEEWEGTGRGGAQQLTVVPAL